ncbi:MAG: hypothetical protein Q9195_005329 [Heterodermia aff. obscurata]
MAPVTRQQVYQGPMTRSRSTAKHPRANIPPPAARIQRRQTRRRRARQHRPAARPIPPPIARPAARPALRQVVVAIDNRDALLRIARDQVQALQLEVRRLKERIEAAKEQGRQEIRAKMFETRSSILHSLPSRQQGETPTAARRHVHLEADDSAQSSPDINYAVMSKFKRTVQMPVLEKQSATNQRPHCCSEGLTVNRTRYFLTGVLEGRKFDRRPGGKEQFESELAQALEEYPSYAEDMLEKYIMLEKKHRTNWDELLSKDRLPDHKKHMDSDDKLSKDIDRDSEISEDRDGSEET